MATALEQLGLAKEDFANPNAPKTGALDKLGLSAQDFQSPGQAGAPGPAAAEPGTATTGAAAAAPGGAPADQLGLASSGALGAAQGLTFGFGDEFAGVLKGALESLPGGQGFQEGFRTGKGFVGDLNERAQPGAFLAGDIAGSLVLPGGAVRAGGTLALKAARAAGSGAIQGAIGGAGRAEGTASERIPEAVAGGALGGVAGGAIGTALPGATRTIQKLVGDGMATVDEAGGRAVGAIQDASRSGQRGVTRAYDEVAKLEGAIEGQAALDLLRVRITSKLDEAGFSYTPGVGEEAMKAADKLLRDLGSNAPVKGARPLTSGAPVAASVQRLEGARKGLVRAIGNLRADPARQAAMITVKKEFDDWMVQSITNGYYRGDAAILDTLHKARGLNAEYQRLFGVGGRTTQDRAAGRIIDQIVHDDVGPGEAVNLIFGLSGAGISASRKAVARIRDIAPEALEQMKVAHFNKIMAPGGGTFDTGAKIASRIQKLNANQGQMMKVLYGDDLGALNRLGADLGKEGNVVRRVTQFFASKPRWIQAGLVATGAVAATATGQNPFIGAILGGLAGRGAPRGIGAGRLAGAARRADRPLGSTVSNRIGRVGGIGPSLAGG